MDKFVGDEVMAVFRGTDALDNAMSLVTRRERIEADLKTVTGVETQIKVALDKGPVYLLKFEGHEVLDPQGSAVDRCARIAKFAKPRLVLASAEVARDSGGDYQWSLAGEVPARGLGRISIFQLGEATFTVRETIEVVKAEHDGLIARHEAKAKHIAELEAHVKKLKEMNRALQAEVRGSDAQPTAESSVEKDSADDERYEELLDAAKRALTPLPSVVVEAFFYSYYGESFHPEPFDDSKWSDVRDACQYRYLEDYDGNFEPNQKNRKVLAAAQKLEALRSFLATEASEEFLEKFADFHKCDADLKDRAFWEGQLGL